MSPEHIMRPILIMAGGTGGHVYPALAVAEYLRNKGVPLFWLGTQQGLEARVIPQHGIKLLTVDVGGVRGKSLLRKLIAPFIILRAVLQSLAIILRIRPALVLGMGGFASGPGGVAAWLCRIPVCIHEQNAIAGLTNRLLAPLATLVMQAFPGSFQSSAKVRTYGNPLRTNMTADDHAADSHSSVRILIVGGSLGALKLNRTIPDAVALMAVEQELEITHQTGDKHLEITQQYYQEKGVKAKVVAFIDDMASAYHWADIVICRAGAMTVAEISAVGLAAVFVPFPYAVDDHQTANARYLSDQGYALLIPESELTVEKISELLTELINDPDRREMMAKGARGCARLEATRDVAEACWEVAYA